MTVNELLKKIARVREMFVAAKLERCVAFADESKAFLERWIGTEHEADAIKTVNASISKYIDII